MRCISKFHIYQTSIAKVLTLKLNMNTVNFSTTSYFS